jgi:Flp pilus assembly protein TadG
MRTLFRLIGRFGSHRRFIASRDGNVAITFSLVLVPTIYLLGMALDYTQAYRKQSQLDDAADAAAIAAVTPAMMAQSVSVATTAAQNIFNATGPLG